MTAAMDKLSPSLLVMSREACNHEFYLLLMDGIKVSVPATEGDSTPRPDSLPGQGGEGALQTRERVRAGGTPDGEQTWKSGCRPALDCPSSVTGLRRVDGFGQMKAEGSPPFAVSLRRKAEEVGANEGERPGEATQSHPNANACKLNCLDWEDFLLGGSI